MNTSATHYVGYLQLDKILNAQNPRPHSPIAKEHDEMLFIIIHQVYELWFKEMLHELDYLMGLLNSNDTHRAAHTFHRLLTILKTVVAQIDVLETMTPLEFSSFRSFLDTASGFQSVQFRELEFACGHKRKTILNQFPPHISGQPQLEKRFYAPTLWDTFLHYLHNAGHLIPDTHLNRDVTQPIAPSTEIQAVLINVYRNDPQSQNICERMVDFDEGLQEWRYRHVKMVSRTIGTKKGTGGSSGVPYLQSTIRPLFPDLWAIRAEL